MGVVLHRRSVETDEGLETPSGGSQSFVVVTNVPLPNHVRRVVGKSHNFVNFDYEERPGSDAVRFQYFGKKMRGFEIAVAPQRTWKQVL